MRTVENPTAAKPRRNSVRRLLQSIHLWAALTVGLFLVLATLSGVIAMFLWF